MILALLDLWAQPLDHKRVDQAPGIASVVAASRRRCRSAREAKGDAKRLDQQQLVDSGQQMAD